MVVSMQGSVTACHNLCLCFTLLLAGKRDVLGEEGERSPAKLPTAALLMDIKRTLTLLAEEEEEEEDQQETVTTAATTRLCYNSAWLSTLLNHASYSLLSKSYPFVLRFR